MAGGKGKVAGKGLAVAMGEGAGEKDRSIKYIHEADGSWMADEFQPHLTLINDRLEKIPLGAVSGVYSLQAPAEDGRLNDFGRKDNRFFMVPS